jgi:bifunctional DNA-binding transcriptional regulator/antitoxin component of YhaV-PrlF toxin-antitoxin module
MEDQEIFAFQSFIEESNNKLWGAHFTIPLHVSAALSSDEERRVVCLLNDQIEYQCAMLHKGDGSLLITVNKKIREQLRLKPGSQVQVQLRKDTSEYGLPVPEELAAVLEQYPEGRQFFQALSPGKQRTLLYIAGNVKNSDKRIERSLAIVEHLIGNQGKIDYKQLNLKLKGQ